jgi:hypothetical protein
MTLPAKRVRQESDGTWGANVWWGSHNPTTMGRYYYRTRREALQADISDQNAVRHNGEYLERETRK